MIHNSYMQTTTRLAERKGVLPTKQVRSKATQKRLIAAGYRLLATRDLEGLSVAEIAMAAGCSVGAFYLRFENKDAFFRALISHKLEEGRELARATFSSDSDGAIEEFIETLVARYRQQRGLLRAALRRTINDPLVWEPLRQLGFYAADQLIARWQRKHKKRITTDQERRLRFAFQMLYGTLHNSLLGRAGPVDLDDAAFAPELTRAFRLLVEAA
jgi:AcrR family transcriptional regulator